MAGIAKSFVSDNPEMLAKWDYEKNAALGFYPEETAQRTTVKRVFWKCQYGHSYDDTPAHQYERGCPICSGRRFISGINDFATIFPENCRRIL